MSRPGVKAVDVCAIMFQCWERQSFPEEIGTLITKLIENVNDISVFEDVEFYMPEFAHMSIHVKDENAAAAIERLLVVFSLISAHFALQLSFIYFAAMQDFQPEMSNGQINSTGNSALYARCSHLLQNVERCFIYGSADKILSFGKSESSANIKKDEKHNHKVVDHGTLCRIADCKVLAVDSNKSSADSNCECDVKNEVEKVSGHLQYKRVIRKSLFHSKGWKERYFEVRNRVLFCYRDNTKMDLLRALPLQDCEIVMENAAGSKYSNYFEVINNSLNVRFLLRASSPDEYRYWTGALKCEMNLPVTVDGGVYGFGGRRVCSPSENKPSSLSTASDRSASSSSSPELAIDTLTPAQEKRYEFFNAQRQFIRTATDICENLRFVEKTSRGTILKSAMAKISIPAFCYIPLCKSTDPWRYILQSIPNECHAFTTKARVPSLMFFEVEEHPDKMDVASFLAFQLQEYVSIGDHVDSSQRCIGKRKQSENSMIVGSLEKDDEVSVISDPGTIDGDSSFVPISLLSSRRPISIGKTIPVKFENCSVFNFPDVNGKNNSHNGSFRDHDSTDRFSFGGENFKGKAVRLQNQSNFGHLGSWQLDGMLAKSNDDVRQEVFIMQLIYFFRDVFMRGSVDVWVLPYRIMSTSKTTGVIQLIKDAISLDSLKKRPEFPGDLAKYFSKTYGDGSGSPSAELKNATINFVKSLAGYSIVAYILAIKDRHNGNIMIDTAGHLIHIDFGFVFGLAPGKQMSLELPVPWKLTEEYVAVMDLPGEIPNITPELSEELNAYMGGSLLPQSRYFAYYKKLCTDAFIAARNHQRELETMITIMSHQSQFPAFRYNSNALNDLTLRLFIGTPDSSIAGEIVKLINKSYNNLGTRMYDQFQLATNGISI